ncbi:hypothetical protein B0O99DRAFT_675641 [Bisporella sp. PMI_857]|nr:hypothetical protein B0O99DRAFT_675641 [Bisporella sp. PMI_857]
MPLLSHRFLDDIKTPSLFSYTYTYVRQFKVANYLKFFEDFNNEVVRRGKGAPHMKSANKLVRAATKMAAFIENRLSPHFGIDESFDENLIQRWWTPTDHLLVVLEYYTRIRLKRTGTQRKHRQAECLAEADPSILVRQEERYILLTRKRKDSGYNAA